MPPVPNTGGGGGFNHLCPGANFFMSPNVPTDGTNMFLFKNPCYSYWSSTGDAGVVYVVYDCSLVPKHHLHLVELIVLQ